MNLCDELAKLIEAATTRQAVIAFSQRIQHVSNITERDKLAAIVRRRLDEFKK